MAGISRVGPTLGIDGLTFDTAAEHCAQIFERRFRGDREAGYAELESAMEGKTPSLGYSLLAEIIQHTRHRVVVTTNFDNLVADALAMHARQSPLVVAHESLAGFVRPQLRRPLVAKIHRNLFLNPKNRGGPVTLGYERGSWDFSAMFDVVLPKLEPAKQAFYRVLGAAILDADRIGELDSFEVWRATVAADPFADL